MSAYHNSAAIVSTGDELALGQRLDTNSRWLAQRLTDLGLEVREHVTLPDDADALEGCLRRMSSRVDVVVMTGGLGPTQDDLTREALARVMGEELVEDHEAVNWISALFARSGRVLTEANRVQALRPRSARCLRNDHGTAPGLHAVAACGGRTVDVFCLPGPPSEMMPMFEAHVAPGLRADPGLTAITGAVPTVGMPESEIGRRLSDMMRRDAEVMVGTTASQGVVVCRLRYRGPRPRDEAQRLVDGAAAEIHRRLGAVVFATQDITLAHAVVGELRAGGETLATAESCTGGLVGGAVTDVAGSSDVYVGGWVTYSNAMKSALLGVNRAILEAHGAVSRACAIAMASGALERSGATRALGVTGVAGPGGGSPEKPVGMVWIALATRGHEAVARRFQFPGDRASVRQWAVVSALALARLGLIGALDQRLLRERPE